MIVYSTGEELFLYSCVIFRVYLKCYGHACFTQTLSYASVRVLVRLNTARLLKRAALERKKSDGAYRTLFPLAPLGFA